MDDDRDILAAEYALGTLDPGERAQADALRASDEAFAARVGYWENRLSELTAMVEPVEPPSAIWHKIVAKVTTSESVLPAGGMAEAADPQDAPRSRGAEIIDLTSRLRRWRGATYIASALAASLLLFVAVREAYQPRQAEAGRFVAVLQRDAVSPGFLLTVDLKSKEFTVRRVGADAKPDRSYELWLVHDVFPQPRSLGVIGTSEFTRAALAAYDAKIINEATYAVSLEPPGGSPTGVATGPIVYVGKLIEAAP